VAGIDTKFSAIQCRLPYGADDIPTSLDGYNKKEPYRDRVLANRAIYDNAAVTTVFPDPEELDSIDYRSKLELTENVRLVIIEGIDVCACCAPHLKTTGQVGVIRIFDSIRHKGGVRVHMLAGLDAFEDLLTKSKNVAAISNLLSSKQNETAAAVGRLKEENEAINKRDKSG
jgi:alanyl-tRNA synthetase